MATVVVAQPPPDLVWQSWASTNATTMGTQLIQTATTATIWTNWNQTYAIGTTSATMTLPVITWANWNSTYEETAEQRAAREVLLAEGRERAARAKAEREAARKRSEELLEFVLTDEQMADYRERGFFEVVSSKGRRWRIRARGQAGNVDLMPETGNERDATYCIHPRYSDGGVPDPDAHLAQALMLATDEDEFLRVANRSWVRLAA